MAKPQQHHAIQDFEGVRYYVADDGIVHSWQRTLRVWANSYSPLAKFKSNIAAEKGGWAYPFGNRRKGTFRMIPSSHVHGVTFVELRSEQLGSSFMAYRPEERDWQDFGVLYGYSPKSMLQAVAFLRLRERNMTETLHTKMTPALADLQSAIHALSSEDAEDEEEAVRGLEKIFHAICEHRLSRVSQQVICQVQTVPAFESIVS